ncbi:MAG: hypothetical protein VBE63_18230 [Lamprobacter sp.]|uniref:hypothetical protein n=1 Tax=Lamprobacter sp. TaxID=3100796 RepID=UPI002B259D76|nr:hypothetical protein [Lamprobacter sp.]MEA3641853.1 hypothetical protein [Lamprobacter sp.]
MTIHHNHNIGSVPALIADECDSLCELLLEKNERYGNSALEPTRLFSSADPIEQIKVRIDDKLSRLRHQHPDDREDTELDLLGYLILLRVARRQQAAQTMVGGLI